MEFSRPEYWSGWPFPSPGDLPTQGIKPRSPALQADSLPAEPAGKPKNTGVGSLSVLRGIFPAQESNWDLPHCRWILYQLSQQGSPAQIAFCISDMFDNFIMNICFTIGKKNSKYFKVKEQSSYFIARYFTVLK